MALLLSFEAAGWVAHLSTGNHAFWKTTAVLFTWYSTFPVAYALLRLLLVYGQSKTPEDNQEFWFIFQVVLGSYFCIYTVTQLM